MKSMLSAAMVAALALAGGSLAAPTAHAAEANIECRLSFTLSGWSLIFKHAEGEGVIRCANGQTLPVNISVKGGGLTAGKFHIDNGKGRFTNLHHINDALGNYIQAEAHAGVGRSANAQVLTKGTVSLALAGNGEGVDLGVGVGAFTLSAR